MNLEKAAASHWQAQATEEYIHPGSGGSDRPDFEHYLQRQLKTGVNLFDHGLSVIFPAHQHHQALNVPSSQIPAEPRNYLAHPLI